MLVNNNIPMYVNRQLNINNQNKIGSIEKLSSGYRINRSADDTAGLAISEKMNARMRALRRCENNIQEGISLCQTADGALEEVSNMLSRVNELCVQAANGANTAEDRTKIAEEIKEIYAEMDRVFENTEFNKVKVFRYAGVDNSDGLNASSYTETVTMLPTGQFKEWGEMLEIIGEKEFELAEPAKGASVTLTLDDDVDLNDAMTLEGKSFNFEFKFRYFLGGKINEEEVKVEFSSTQSGFYQVSGETTIYYVQVNSNETIQDAFNKILEKSHDKDTFEYADSFEYTDTSQSPPVTNTIHNYFVELKDVENAENIVEQIVTQLKPNMDHYIDVEANGSSLVLKDIRSGNLLDSNGVINRAKVISGVYTNFTYDVDKNKVFTVYDLVAGGTKDTNAFWSCAIIYSSDIGEDNYIPIHLPNFSVKNLKLKQLNVQEDDLENINEVMKRAKTATEIVSIARGKIGADQNRLEHAKLSILADVSQAIMAQVTRGKEQILRLLQ